MGSGERGVSSKDAPTNIPVLPMNLKHGASRVQVLHTNTKPCIHMEIPLSAFMVCKFGLKTLTLLN